VSTAGTPRSARTIPPFGYDEYLRFSKLVRNRCGLYFSERRRDDLERSVRQAFAASTCTDLNEYYHLLQDPERNGVHFERLVNTLTARETHFFRNAGQVDALYYHVLPELIERRRSSHTLRIWSAGCASGEEPYSIAMLLRELLPNVDEWYVTILGTDINTEALARARQAAYSEWAFREERAKERRSRYFHRRGNRYELIPAVRKMVTFGKLNPVEDVYPSHESNTNQMDLILCRNLMIDFTEPVSQGIVDQFYECLTPEGWLLVDHAAALPFTGEGAAALPFTGEGAAALPFTEEGAAALPFTGKGAGHSPVISRRFQAHDFPNAILYRRGSESPPPPGEEKGACLTFPTAPPVNVVDSAVEKKQSAPKPKAKIETGPEPELEEEEETGLDYVYIHSLGRLGHVDPAERAKELLSYGRSEEARDYLLGLVETGPPTTSTCVILGQAYANLGHWEEAERWCREAIRLDILALDAYYTLALVLQHQGQLDEAIDAMKKVIYIDHQHALGHFGLANLYRSKGQLAQALKSLDNALRPLERYTRDDFIPGSYGITAGSLQETIVHQQQRWRAEAASLSTVRQGGQTTSDREWLTDKLSVASQKH
jgi:chemotaxis protein methyltransferase CheR